MPPTFKIERAKVLVERYNLGHLYTYSKVLETSPNLRVAVYEGDTVLDELRLDLPEDGATNYKGVFGLLFTGSLTVRGAISNQNDNGALGLAVLGNLKADRVAIGGQETYVRGNVDVTGVLCGSYNHGEILVEGNLSAGLLISDDYRFWIRGNLRGPVAATETERIGLLEGRPRDVNMRKEDDTAGRGYGGARWTEGTVPLDLALIDDCWDGQELLFKVLAENVADGRPVFRNGFPEKIDLKKLEKTAPHVAEARRLYDDDEPQRALVLFRKALKAGYPEVIARHWIAACLYELERFNEAIPHYTFCIDNGYEVEENKGQRASSHLRTSEASRDYEAAWKDCDDVLAEKTSPPGWAQANAHNLHGFSLFQRDRYDEAIPHFQKALQIDDCHYNANSNLAKCLWYLDREEEALVYAKRAVAIDPEQDYMFYIKGYCHFTLKQFKEAISDLERYVRAVSTDAHAWRDLARAYVAENRLEEALKSAEEIFKVDPKERTRNAEGFIAFALWMLDREPEGLPYAKRAVDRSPAPGYHTYIKGCCCRAVGDFVEAFADWESYVAVAPKDLHGWTTLAENYKTINRPADALRCARRALALDPDNDVARNVMDAFSKK
jgi:tetratricopeptide (TPR) repeat protein